MGLRSHRLALAVVLCVFFALGLYYALDTPLYSRPDEGYHYSYVLYLRANGALPAVDTSRTGLRNRPPYEPEAHQPPLYYALVWALSGPFAIGVDGVPAENPHLLSTGVGNQNRFVPCLVSSPADAPVYFIGRLVSLAFGGAGLLFAYLLLRLFLPWPLAMLGAAMMGFTPQYLYIGTSFSNDMAGASLANLGLWQVGVALQKGLTRKRGLWLGAVVAAATLTKLGGLGLLVPIGATAVWQAWSSRRWQPLLWAVVSGLVAAALASWWFWRNWQLYGDPFALNALTLLLGVRARPMPPQQLRQFLEFLWKSFWLDFSPGELVFAESYFYWAVAALCWLGMGGLIVFLRREAKARPFLLLVGLWSIVVLVSFLRLTMGTAVVMGGGRLLLPAAVAAGLAITVGLSELAGRRWLAAVPPVIGLVLFSAIAPSRYLEPVYPRPQVLAKLDRQPAFPSGVRFGENQLELIGYDLDLVGADTSQPSLGITYYWRVLKPTERNLSVFIQLLNRDRDGKWAQIDTYPGFGTSPTSRWKDGQIIVDRLRLPLPAAGQPADGDIVTGVYFLPTMPRPPLFDRQGTEIANASLTIAQVRVAPSGQRQVLVNERVVAETSLEP